MVDHNKEHKGGGDRIHRVTAHMEHLMDLFEIALAVICAVGFILGVIPLFKELPVIASLSTGTEEFRHFLEHVLDLVIGIEFIKMLIKHTPSSVIEVLVFALSRHMVLEGGGAKENLITVIAIAIIFAVRKFLIVEQFEFLKEGEHYDWLSDWKVMRDKSGASMDRVKKSVAGKKKKRPERTEEAAEAEAKEPDVDMREV